MAKVTRPQAQVLDLTYEEGPLTIVSPFITLKAFKRFLSFYPLDVQIIVYTRWLPSEIALGVSDPAILELAEERGNVSIFLLRELHAKLYLRGAKGYVGSANLTGPGFGWSANPNLELVVQISSDTPEITDLLMRLSRYATRANREIADVLKNAAAIFLAENAGLTRLREGYDIEKTGSQGSESDPHSLSNLEATEMMWVPRCSQPSRLYVVYCDATHPPLLSSLREDALSDLAFLQVPKGLGETDFVRFVRVAYAQTSIFSVCDRLIRTSINPVIDLAAALNLDPELGPPLWQDLSAWLLCWFPHVYKWEAPIEAYRVVALRPTPNPGDLKP